MRGIVFLLHKSTAFGNNILTLVIFLRINNFLKVSLFTERSENTVLTSYFRFIIMKSDLARQIKQLFGFL
jgi:hypothetical protein